MRLWSIHPFYLDAAGLTACWREGLLARKVLSGQTKGYRNHPQLSRFLNCSDPMAAIDSYLSHICDEADKRGYKFDRNKITNPNTPTIMQVTSGQLMYEFTHLKKKLAKRSPDNLVRLDRCREILPHPVFTVTEGETEPWETIK